jgi:hypothetical protein
MNADNYVAFAFTEDGAEIIKHLWINSFEVSNGKLYIFIPCNTETLWVGDDDHLEYLIYSPLRGWKLLTCKGYEYPITIEALPDKIHQALNRL